MVSLQGLVRVSTGAGGEPPASWRDVRTRGRAPRWDEE
jgi:hypothetical protein